MRTAWLGATVVAIILALNSNANAQTPGALTSNDHPPSKETHNGSSRTTNRADETVKLTGCVRNEKDIPGRHAGFTSDYVLMNAKVTSPGDMAAMTMPSTFTVKGAAEPELKQHLGHQVEVTGHFTNTTARDLFHPEGATGPTPGMKGGSTTHGGDTTGGVTTSSPVDAGSKDATAHGAYVSPNTDLPRIEATGVRMLAASCSAQ